MRPERKGARDALKAIPTKAELAARLEASTLTDQQRQAVWLVYGEGVPRVSPYGYGVVPQFAQQCGCGATF